METETRGINTGNAALGSNPDRGGEATGVWGVAIQVADMIREHAEIPSVSFIVPGEPVPKARARIISGGKGQKPRGITPKRTRDHETLIKLCARSAKAKKLTGLLFFLADFRVGDKRRKDLDNLEKAALDAMNGLCYEDDGQIAMKMTRLIRVPKGQALTEIFLAPLCETVAWAG